MPCRLSTMGNVLTNRFQQGMLHHMAIPPRMTELMWPDATRGPWWVKVWWRVQHGVPTPVGMSVKSWVEQEESRASGPHNHLPLADEDQMLPRLDSQLVRSLPIGSIVDACRAQLVATMNRESAPDWPDEWKQSMTQWRDATATERDALNNKRTGRDLGDDHYREVATVYARAVHAGEPPTKAVADHFTVEKSSAAKKVSRARDRGFLPQTTRGRVGPLTKEI